MKEVLILGTGCAKCATLAQRTREALADLHLELEVEKITDLARFVEYGVMITPALVVDGAVLVAGRVPSREETRELLAAAGGNEGVR